MGYIKQLSEDLIKKIAAGEVIERPASVVKELLENSIDAGATKIEIEVERGGKYIKVSDNGMGIEPDDIDLLFARHATSKIKNFDDLWRVDTLGFRGEALASVSAVSKITCRSKHINQDYGFEIKEIAGKINKKSSAVSIGTIFEIDDLFYNVPARQKFLKSESTEYGHIQDIVISLGLSHPEIAITLKNNKAVILKTSGSKDLKQTINELLGEDLQNKLIPVSGKNNFLTFEGFLSALEIFRSDRKSIFIFVNGRPVKCQIVSKAVLSAFEGLLPAGKFPVVILNLVFKPKFVDINVHPSKKEVRYTQSNDVYNLILHSVQNAVAGYYKKQYEEKSVYALPESSNLKSEMPFTGLTKESRGDNASSNLQDSQFSRDEKETKAAFDLYTPEREVKIEQYINIFSIPNLKCKIIYSDKPIADMNRIGNKTIFEVGSIFEENLQIVFSGEIIGEQNYQRDFFNYLSNLSTLVYKTYSANKQIIQKKIISKDLEEEDAKDKNRKKPQVSLLYKVWERDNWTCVYCKKQLLDPEVVKKATPEMQDASGIYVAKLREHLATYDHYLPVSRLPQFNFDEENLFASCVKCNIEKSNSMDQKAWRPERYNSWGMPLEIGGLVFSGPEKFNKLSLK